MAISVNRKIVDMISTYDAEILDNEAQKNSKKFSKNLSIQIVSIFLLLCAILGGSLIYIDKLIMLDTLVEARLDRRVIMNQKILEEISNRLIVAEAVSASIADLSKVMPKDPALFKKQIPALLNKKGYEGLIAGGGYWPEPYVFDKKKERSSFFWGRDKDGQLKFYDDYNDPNGNGYLHEEWYVPVRYAQDGRCYWSKSYVDSYSGQPMVTCSTPIYENGKFTGVATVDLKLDGLGDLIKDSVKSIGGYGFIVDRNNKFIYYPDEKLIKSEPENISSENITAEDLAQKNPIFESLASALSKQNEMIVSKIEDEYKTSSPLSIEEPELIDYLVKNSYQINAQEAEMIAVILEHSAHEEKHNFDYLSFSNILLDEDDFLNEPVFSDFLVMPQTYWKIVIVTPQSVVIQKANETFIKLIFYTVAIILVIFFLFFAFIRARMLKPVENIIRSIKESTESQTIKLNDMRNDELGEIAYWYNIRTKEMMIAREAAENASRVKSDFLANMSHEIRTPMNAVLGLSNLLLDTKLESEQKHYVLNLKNAGEGLLHIINDIIDISKIEAGKLVFEKTDFDFFDLLQEVTNLFAHQAREKGIEMLIKIDSNLPRFLTGDPVRIKQIFANLISNAIKFTSKGHVLVSVQLVSLENGMVNLDCIVQDTGIGISPENQRKVFEKFTQAEESTTRRFGGTGLGLAIVSELIELMGGGISLESQPEEGSSFRFNIVLGLAAQQERLKNDEDIDALRVLVIDDYSFTRDLLVQIFERKHIACQGVLSAKEALDLLAKEEFDSCFVDYNLGGDMNGLMFVEEIRKNPRYKKMSLIMVSGVLEGFSYDELKNQGLDGFIKKPFLQHQILNALRISVKNRREGTLDAPLITRQSTTDVMDEYGTGQIKYAQYPDCKVLVVEDMKMNMLIINKVLQKFGCKIEGAVNGIEALNKVKGAMYDMIFMDCQMPEMDGFTATKLIREYELQNGRGPVPIIALTADAMTGDREKCLAIGMNDYINKPFKEQDIAKALEKWCKDKAG